MTAGLWKASFFFVHLQCILLDISPNAGKYGPEITPYLDTYHAVVYLRTILNPTEAATQRCS